jgi:hypothetical protein
MGGKQNCWEFMKCGREPGGRKVAELDICPVTTNTSVNGTNSGKNGGRICWTIAGTLSGGKVLGTFAKEKFTCVTCDFFKLVEKEEGIDNFKLFTPDKLLQYKSQIYGRRKSIRVDIHLDIEIKPTKDTTEYLVGVTRNFSHAGFSFVSEDFDIKPKELIKFRIKHPRKDTFVSVLGDIVWNKKIRDRCLVGIKFQDIESQIKARF